MTDQGEGGPLLQTVERAFGVLEQFLARKDEPMRVADLAKALKLNRTTTWRLVTTLETLGYLERCEGERFRLGLKLYYYGSLIQNRFDVRRIAESVMERLRQESTESVYLWIRVGQKRVCIHALESSRPVRHQISVGEILPLHAGAGGKLLLAYEPPDQLEEYLGQLVPRPPSANTITQVEELRRDLDTIRQQGYATSRGERFSETFSVAAPIRDHSGAVVAALSLAGPSARMRGGEGRYIDQVCSAAGEVSRLMGYQVPANQAS
ncbi:MAG: IclR family transcriptional regulator [Betaproteobacteria bacterium]